MTNALRDAEVDSVLPAGPGAASPRKRKSTSAIQSFLAAAPLPLHLALAADLSAAAIDQQR
jgi:hypothetical protein